MTGRTAPSPAGRDRTRVLLVGLMGSGKSSLGRALGARLGCPFLDNDALLVAQEGADAATLGRQGTVALRAAEGRVLTSVLTRPGPWVATAAAGTVLDPDLRAAARRSGVVVVWVRVPEPDLLARLERAREPDHGGAAPRPWLTGDLAGTVHRMVAERHPQYAELADLTVDGRQPEATLAAQVASALGAPAQRQ